MLGAQAVLFAQRAEFCCCFVSLAKQVLRLLNMWAIAKRTIDDKGQFDSKTGRHILRILANHTERNIIEGNEYNAMTVVLFTGVMCWISFYFRKNEFEDFFFFFSKAILKAFYSVFSFFIWLVLFSIPSLKPDRHFSFLNFVLHRWVIIVSFFIHFGKELKLIQISHLTANMWCVKQ